jgi:hypothetical protein
METEQADRYLSDAIAFAATAALALALAAPATRGTSRLALSKESVSIVGCHHWGPDQLEAYGVFGDDLV